MTLVLAARHAPGSHPSADGTYEVWLLADPQARARVNAHTAHVAWQRTVVLLGALSFADVGTRLVSDKPMRRKTPVLLPREGRA